MGIPTLPLTVGSTFTGAGGLDMAIKMLWPDHELAWFSEVDNHAAAVFSHHHPDVPNLGDITVIDWDDVEPVDVLVGGFPCQPVSLAGKRDVDQDERWLWNDLLAGIATLRPALVLLENVPGIFSAKLTGVPDADRCLCGWPYRWGGLPEPGSRNVGEVVHPPAGHRDDASSSATPAGTERSVRGDDQQYPQSDREVGGGVGVASHRRGSGSPAGAVVAASGAQEETSRTAPVSPANTTVVRLGGEHPGDVDRRSIPGVRDYRRRGQESESEGSAPRCPTRLDCPGCGRDAGEQPDEPSDRIAVGAVLGSLSQIGFDAEWTYLRASDVGAPHGRARWFAAAWNSTGSRRHERPDGLDSTETGSASRARRPSGHRSLGRGHSPSDLTLLPTPTSVQGRRTSGRTDPHSDHHDGTTLQDVAYDASWREYTDAIWRWETITGRSAPTPTDDERRLSPEFVEWMMGWPAGWTGVAGASRTQRLKMLGNGVVPQQAAHAYSHLLAVEEVAA